MKIKIGKFLFDPNQMPVMLVLNDRDKANIAAMDPEANSYAAFPDGYDHKAVQNWMADEDVVEVEPLHFFMMESDSIRALINERVNQVIHGYDREHDLGHGSCVLSGVASEVILQSSNEDSGQDDEFGIIQKHGKNRVRLLQIAGALIAAELEMAMNPEVEEFTSPTMGDMTGRV
jgi:hypothetical protein